MSRFLHSLRALIALLVTWSFLALAVSSIVLYIMPHGRVAYWTDWQLLGLGKDAWSQLHLSFGALLIIAGSLHLYFNWHALVHYLATRVRGHLRLSKELIGSLLLTVLIGVGALTALPPFSWVFALNEAIKQSWIIRPELAPPFGHAERVSLRVLARRMDFELAAAMQALRRNGIDFTGPEQTIEMIATANGLSPMELYGLLPIEPVDSAKPGRHRQPQQERPE